MKLKQLLKETKVWERKFGESLPTLEDTTKAYKLKLEQEFKAKSKETGRVVVYKSKENMDKAIKGGKAEPLDKKTSGKPEKVKGADLFKKDKSKVGTKPKGDTTADTLTKGLKDGGLNPYKDGSLINQALDDIGGDHSDLKKKIDTYGDNLPSSKGKSEAQYQKEIDKYKEEGKKLSNDIVDAVSDKPKGKKMQITMDFQSSDKKDLERFADRYGLKVSNINNNPNYGLEAEFEGSSEDLKKFMTSDDYGLDPKDFDQYAKEYGDELDVDPKIDKQMSSAADKANMKMDRDEIKGILKKKDEPFADEVEEILMDKFKDMGSTGKKLKQKLDTIASYEMGIYDMSEKEYNQEKKEVKKELDDYYKKQGLDESLKELSKISTRYNR